MRALLAAAILVGFLVVGCHSGEPGIQVEVRAEPKTGYNPPEEADNAYGYATTGKHDHAFHRISYSRTAGIAVFVEPLSESAATPPANPINAGVDLSSPSAANAEDFQLGSVGGTLRFAEGGEPKYLLRTADGVVSETAPNAKANLSKPGLLEVLSESKDDPVGYVYVAPNGWAKKVRGGEKVTFSPLPPGKYRVTAWHPILPGSTQTVDVTTGQISNVKLTVGVNSLPKPK